MFEKIRTRVRSGTTLDAKLDGMQEVLDVEKFQLRLGESQNGLTPIRDHRFASRLSDKIRKCDGRRDGENSRSLAILPPPYETGNEEAGTLGRGTVIAVYAVPTDKEAHRGLMTTRTRFKVSILTSPSIGIGEVIQGAILEDW